MHRESRTNRAHTAHTASRAVTELRIVVQALPYATGSSSVGSEIVRRALLNDTRK